MMRRTVALLLFALVVSGAGPASAFVHFTQNEFTTAESLDPGMTQTGIHFTLGEDYRSYYPVIRYGLGALAEVGFKIGASTADFRDDPKFGSGEKVGALIGVDLKYQLVKEAEGIPLDMAVDIGFDNTLMNSKNASEVTFSTLLSRNLPLTERGYRLTPYGGLELSAIYGSGVPENDTAFYVIAGLEWKLTQKFMFHLEYKGGDSNVGGLGIRFEY